MRALAIHEDVIVVVSGVWQTTCTAVRSGDEGFLIDSPVLPDELDALPSLFEQAGFPVSGLLATHGDWDHLLGALAFPSASLGVGESTAARLNSEVGEAQRRLREFDAEWYIAGRKPLGLGSFQGLPVPGRLSIGSQGGSGVEGGAGEIEVHPADGHTGDGVAYWIPWASVLVCGDYLSPVEIPMISVERGGSPEAYRETLMRFAPLLSRAELVVPGHGAPLNREQALAVMVQDVAYLDALLAGGAALSGVTLPEGRRGAAQKRIHAANLEAIA
jgi:glyoxylase-like metal-dependent hydrolase (beta-lactamase superfamily II)